jgi:hypothetical protein
MKAEQCSLKKLSDLSASGREQSCAGESKKNSPYINIFGSLMLPEKFLALLGAKNEFFPPSLLSHKRHFSPKKWENNLFCCS